jgi:type I restriction enzyme, S subunit
VPTEAEIARREGRDYESVEVLFERIKKERGKSGKKQ